MFAEKYRARRFKEGREAGREETHKAWEAWYERLKTALDRNEPFDEPPPSVLHREQRDAGI